MNTRTTSTSEMTNQIFAQVDDLREKLEGQVLVSQNRWVDHLLDLHKLVESSPLQGLIEETLSAIRYLGSVEGEWLSERLVAIASAVEVESAFDATAALIH